MSRKKDRNRKKLRAMQRRRTQAHNKGPVYETVITVKLLKAAMVRYRKAYKNESKDGYTYYPNWLDRLRCRGAESLMLGVTRFGKVSSAQFHEITQQTCRNVFEKFTFGTGYIPQNLEDYDPLLALGFCSDVEDMATRALGMAGNPVIQALRDDPNATLPDFPHFPDVKTVCQSALGCGMNMLRLYDDRRRTGFKTIYMDSPQMMDYVAAYESRMGEFPIPFGTCLVKLPIDDECSPPHAATMWTRWISPVNHTVGLQQQAEAVTRRLLGITVGLPTLQRVDPRVVDVETQILSPFMMEHAYHHTKISSSYVGLWNEAVVIGEDDFRDKFPHLDAPNVQFYRNLFNYINTHPECLLEGTPGMLNLVPGSDMYSKPLSTRPTPAELKLKGTAFTIEPPEVIKECVRRKIRPYIVPGYQRRHPIKKDGTRTPGPVKVKPFPVQGTFEEAYTVDNACTKGGHR